MFQTAKTASKKFREAQIVQVLSRIFLKSIVWLAAWMILTIFSFHEAVGVYTHTQIFVLQPSNRMASA